MRPMQVWVPALGNSVGLPWVRRDMQRAYEAWRDEEVMFLVPGLAEVRRWLMTLEKLEANSAVAAVPGEHPETVFVLHLSANGYLWKSLQTPAWRIDGLLEAWLNFDVQNGRLISPPSPTMWLPSVENGVLVERDKAIRFESIVVETAAPPTVPISILDEERREIGIHWPPDERWPATVHPDAEAADYPPQYSDGTDRADEDGGPRGLYYWWPPPFGFLFGLGAGLDVFKALVDMRKISAEAAKGRQAALSRARLRASDYLSEGDSTLWSAVILPTALALGPDGFTAAAWETHGIIATDLAEASKSPRANERVPVVRAWGGIGLLWALLIDRLESDRPFHTCELCGRLLSARRKVCGKRDDARCYKSRRAADKRRSRAKMNAPHSSGRGGRDAHC